MERDQRVRFLYTKLVNNSISSQELHEMLDYFREYGIPEEFDQLLLEDVSKDIDYQSFSESKELLDRVERKLIQKIQGPQVLNFETGKSQKRNRTIIGAAAAAAIILIVGGWFIWNSDQKEISADLSAFENGSHITPAENRATIKLSDGRIINLDDRQNGILMDGDQITYRDDASEVMKLQNTQKIEWITLSTPKGGTYHITLSDGTKVWLNAASTIKYPSRFTPSERVIYLEGEAYFDVKNQGLSSPFKVISEGQTVQVLGTQFNLSAYQDENNIKTTLVEGKVSIQIPNQANDLVLLPGEQGRVGENTANKIKVDVRDYIDWKNGEFVFREETAQELMLRIARWYDVQVDYQKGLVFKERFSGTISRYDHLNTVLDIMEEAGDLVFNVKDRTVLVGRKNNINLK